jgi:ribosomal protein L40E
LERTSDEEVKFRIKRCLQRMEEAGERFKICTECQRRNPADARYCAGCGAMLPGWWELIGPFRGRQGMRYLLAVAVGSLLLSVVLSVVMAQHYLIAMLCFWWAALAMVCYLYKRVTLY